jgi:hypothetical protein
MPSSGRIFKGRSSNGLLARGRSIHFHSFPVDVKEAKFQSCLSGPSLPSLPLNNVGGLSCIRKAFPPTEELLPHTSWPANKITCGLEECGCVNGEESKYQSVESSEITYSCCTECWLQISDVFCLFRSSANLYHEVGDKSDPAVWQECDEMWSRVLNEGQFVCIFSWSLFCSVEWEDLAVFKLKTTNYIPLLFIFV